MLVKVELQVSPLTPPNCPACLLHWKKGVLITDNGEQGWIKVILARKRMEMMWVHVHCSLAVISIDYVLRTVSVWIIVKGMYFTSVQIICRFGYHSVIVRVWTSQFYFCNTIFDICNHQVRINSKMQCMNICTTYGKDINIVCKRCQS